MRRLPASGECPRCGYVQGITAHLVKAHKFAKSRAQVVAVRLVSKERLAPRDAQQLGVPVVIVRKKGTALSRATLQDIPGLGPLPSPEAVRAAVEGMR